MASMSVTSSKPHIVANMVVRRSDGHELSYSSVDHDLIEWDEDNLMVNQYGWVSDPHKYLKILTEFLAGE